VRGLYITNQRFYSHYGWIPLSPRVPSISLVLDQFSPERNNRLARPCESPSHVSVSPDVPSLLGPVLSQVHLPVMYPVSPSEGPSESPSLVLSASPSDVPQASPSAGLSAT
jgi:hypothetical protein